MQRDRKSAEGNRCRGEGRIVRHLCTCSPLQSTGKMGSMLLRRKRMNAQARKAAWMTATSVALIAAIQPANLAQTSPRTTQSPTQQGTTQQTSPTQQGSTQQGSTQQ